MIPTGAILCGGLVVLSTGRLPDIKGSRNVVLSTDVPTGEPESSGGDGFEDDPAGDNCPLSDGLTSFVLQNHILRIQLKFKPSITQISLTRTGDS